MSRDNIWGRYREVWLKSVSSEAVFLIVSRSQTRVWLEGSATARLGVRDFEIHWISSGFRISEWISGFLDFKVDFWISKRISGFQSRFLDFKADFWISKWISGFQSGFLDFKVDFSRDFWISSEFLDFKADFWISKWISRGISGFQANFWISKRISGFHLNRYYVF